MSAADVARRHRDLTRRVRTYLDGPYRSLPGGARLGPRLGGATILAVGAHALGTAGAGEPVEIELILADDEWSRLQAETRPSDTLTLDPDSRFVVRIRAAAWLARRLDTTGGLWLRQRAAVVADPQGRLGPAVHRALAAFRARLEDEISAHYHAFREGFETADGALDNPGRTVLLGAAVEGALALPVLARGEPHPPARWLAWYLGQVEPEGEHMAALSARAAGGPRVDREAYAALRRLIDDTLERAGYGERLVRAYRALA